MIARVLVGCRKWIIATAILLPIAVAGWLAYVIHFHFTVTTPNAYALWYTGDLIVAYLREHPREWPTTWDDLGSYWSDVRNSSGRPEMSFEHLKELVEIDWKRLPDGFNQTKEDHEPRLLNLIRRRDGREAHWSCGEPHEIILFHLQSRIQFSSDPFDPSKRLAKALSTISGLNNDQGRLWGLSEAGMAYVELGQLNEAQAVAQEALMLCEQPSKRDEDVIHRCHIILGRIALRKSNYAEAKSQLLKSGEVQRSAVLESFGPNMTLARELLQKGERAAVLEYFTLCEKFWNFGRDKLKAWSEKVKAGKIPDFGANLWY